MEGVVTVNVYPIEPWLQLGVAGAGMFIVLVVVWLVFSNQAKTVDRLCNKIDLLINESIRDREELTKVLVSNDRDQRQIKSRLDSLFKYVTDIHGCITKIDTRLYESGKYKKKDDFNEI